MRKTIFPILAAGLLVAACATAPAPTAAPAPATAAGIDAKALFAAKCAGCHGQDGSKGLKGKGAEAVVAALNGYKAKTYGGAKKAIMENQAASLSDAEVQALAKFVAGL